MTSDNSNDLGKRIRQQRGMRGLTISELTRASGVSQSYLGRIERGERFPSARTLRRIAKPLGFGEAELATLAGYLSPQPSRVSEASSYGQLDPYVVAVLSQEPVEIQRTVIGILTILKRMAEGLYNVEFAEYAHRKYPELDEDIITMLQDIMEHPPKANVLVDDRAAKGAG